MISIGNGVTLNDPERSEGSEGAGTRGFVKPLQSGPLGRYAPSG
jgi:hypothetical protein